ncbi:MAG: carboxypeptidase-like regulatory domain-containing protein, partial [Pyrinomonadaceae bacterium]|nr:carboxypeptidase-like regulatory domain-containing protein [Pyrinomonadaceae bacterium]
MKSVIIFFAVLLTANAAFAQNSMRTAIKDEETKKAVVGATVSIKETEISATTDADGKAELTNIPNGERTVEIFSPGYETKELKLTFPLADFGEQIIFIRVTNEVGEVVISSTRTGREIDDVATRVEAIDEEEVDEKMNMRPANVSMVLNE